MSIEPACVAALSYGLLDFMAQEVKNASANRTDAAKMADALRYAADNGYMLLPVPGGVAYEDALRAVEDARPWVPIDDVYPNRSDVPQGTRVRYEYKWNDATADVIRVHPDDVPDPDADLIEAMAKAMSQARQFASAWEDQPEDIRASWRRDARAALAVARERGAL